MHVELPLGDIVDTKGAKLGEHRGVHRLTVGQRRGGRNVATRTPQPVPLETTPTGTPICDWRHYALGSTPSPRRGVKIGPSSVSSSSMEEEEECEDGGGEDASKQEKNESLAHGLYKIRLNHIYPTFRTPNQGFSDY